jgi:serine/threonine protein kinase
MKLLNLPFDGKPHRYLVFHPRRLPDGLQLARTTTTEAFESVASSRFFLSRDGKILAKVVPDKFDKRQAPLKWLGRDYLEKRWLLQSDARKEFRSGRTLQRLGLSTPLYHGWGVSLNPANRNASLLLMEHISDAQLGGEVFKAMSEQDRRGILDRLCDQVAHIARNGYAARDLHYNNLLVADSGTLIWLDTHLRRLPHRRQARWAMIKNSLTAAKLGGETYRQHAEQRLRALLGDK